MAPKIVNKEEKQRAIALASIDIFGEKGFDRTRMEDVAKAAGVGKGTIYEYFKTKDELMEGAVEALFVDMEGSLMPSFDEDASPSDILVLMLEKTIASVKQVGFAYRFFLEYMIHISRKDQSSTFMANVLTGYRYFLCNLIEQGMAVGEFRDDLEPMETAAALAAWVDGAIFHWYLLPDTVSFEAMGKRFIDATLNGLRRPGGKTK